MHALPFAQPLVTGSHDVGMDSDRIRTDSIIYHILIRIQILAMSASLLIRLFQLVFLAGTIFFSHNKSARTVFRLVFSAKRTGPLSIKTNMKRCLKFGFAFGYLLDFDDNIDLFACR